MAFCDIKKKGGNNSQDSGEVIFIPSGREVFGKFRKFFVAQVLLRCEGYILYICKEQEFCIMLFADLCDLFAGSLGSFFVA